MERFFKLYPQLTIEDKAALEKGKDDGHIYEFLTHDGIRSQFNIDLALAQIAEMESKHNNLLSEKASEKGCMTWNDRINQMTVEEKAKWLYDLDVCRVSSISIDECNSYRHCTECMRNMLNSPYTEGETV